MTPHIEGGDVVVPLGDRVLGRVTACDAFTPTDKDNAVIEAGTLLDEKAVETLERAGVDEVWVRSAITCEPRHGICSKCYGRDLPVVTRLTSVKLWALSLRSPSVSRVP